MNEAREGDNQSYQNTDAKTPNDFETVVKSEVHKTLSENPNADIEALTERATTNLLTKFAECGWTGTLNILRVPVARAAAGTTGDAPAGSRY